MKSRAVMEGEMHRKRTPRPTQRSLQGASISTEVGIGLKYLFFQVTSNSRE